MNRLREESGYTVPIMLAVIALLLGFGAVAITVATHNVDRAERDRLATRAQQAADAGLDAAAYRMNKMLLATKVDNLLSPQTVDALLSEVGCLTASAAESLEVTLTTSAACNPTASEPIDSEVADDGLGKSASFRYYVKLRANVLVSSRSVIERQIISIGEVDGVIKRVSGVYRFDIAAPADSVVSRTSYNLCTADMPELGDDPADGCPAV